MFAKPLLMGLYCFSVTFLEAKASCDVHQPPPPRYPSLLSQAPTASPPHLHVQHTHIGNTHCILLTQCFEFAV